MYGVISVHVLFCCVKEVVHMKLDWSWPLWWPINNFEFRKRKVIKNELWRIWWTICATRIKRKIK